MRLKRQGGVGRGRKETNRVGWHQSASGFMLFVSGLILEAVGCSAKDCCTRVERVTLVAFLEGVLGSRESVKRDEDLNSKREREVWRGERFEGESDRTC